jgi:hypothetical protein
MRRPLAPLLLAVVLLSACSSDPSTVTEPDPSASPSGAPAIEGLVVATEELSHEHVEGPVEYDRVPPVGGRHNPRWLACDVYDEPVPAEFAVHSLEHGAVWFAHAPDLPDEQVDRLAELAKADEEYVLVSPQPGLEAPIVAVTWGASLEADRADDPRLEQFLEAYVGGGQGGEKGAPCRGSGLSLREARGLLEGSA